MSETASIRLQNVEYTYPWYREFLGWLRAEGYRFRSFEHPVDRDEVRLRHDVDLSVERALRMARIEAELGVSAAYFFLLTSPLYNPLEAETREVVREIESLGHDVGLHFSTHAYWPTESPPAASEIGARVEAERAVLETVSEDPLSTVSFHVPPEWVIDRAFDGFRSTYEPAFLSEMDYLADSSQRWRRESPVGEPPSGPVQVLTHPGLWGQEDRSFEACVERAVTDASRRARDRTRREFLDGGGR